MKSKLHAGHLGINSCLRRARELVYWPGMSSDIRQYIEACNICSSMADKQSAEPLVVHPVPSRPWEKVGTDLFSIEGRNYLLTVDYYSNFFEIDYLGDNTTSDAVITRLKHHFARFGIPVTLISDGGPQYTGEKFRTFSNTWGFDHQTSSPGNSKANGAAEAHVKIAKRLMKKCMKGKEDTYLGLLSLRNTPQEGIVTSPAQRMFGRRTRTLIPTLPEKLKPSTVDLDVQRKPIEQKKITVAERYAHRRALKPLSPGETVRMQPIESGKKDWRQATVSTQIKRRSYEVITDDGKKYRRNRQFLRASTPSAKPDSDTLIPEHISAPVTRSSTAAAAATTTPEQQSVNTPPVSQKTVTYQTRSGRAVKEVEKLNL